MTKINKKTVTVGIPALNEEKNIANLLDAIFSQTQNGWTLDRIIVINDGSTDNTSKLVSNYKNQPIKLINHSQRVGKPQSLNEIFTLSTSDIVVTLDADIIINQTDVLEKLVQGFSTPIVELVSGSAHPIKPSNFVSKVLLAGVEIWNTAREKTPNSQMYFCEGQIRAFAKKLYKRLEFPDKSADDIYPFLYLNNKNKFYYAKKAKAFYKNPLTFKELYSQQKRYARSKSIHSDNFNKKVIKKYFVIGGMDKVKAILKNFFSNPVWILLYLVTMVVVKTLISFSNTEQNAKWEILVSTKK